MRAVRARRAAPVAITTALLCTALLPQTSAHAVLAPPKATPYPMAHAISGLTAAGQMVEADGKLFVSSGPAGSTVTVLSTSGVAEETITGLTGADGLVASGSNVYVARRSPDGSGAISVIQAGAAKPGYSTPYLQLDACPHSLALANGRLFYSFGCNGGAGGVASIDPSAPETAPVQALTEQIGPGLLRGHGSTLAVSDASDAVSTYTATGNGTLTELGTTDLEDGAARDMAFTSDGSDLLIAVGAPYQITSYTATAMTQDRVYPGVAYPTAVAADPHGQYVAGGFDSYDATAELYGETSKTVHWARFTTGTNPSTWSAGNSFDAVLPQTMAFSPAGSAVFALVQRENTKGIFFFASTITPTASKVTVKVPNVGVFKAHTATATHVTPGASVTFTLTDPGRTTSLGTAKANAHGTAHVKFGAEYNGTVSAVTIGSASKLPASATAKVHVDSYTASRLIGKHHTKNGIALYTSVKKVRIEFTTSPSEAGRRVTGKFQAFRHGHWKTYQTLPGRESASGIIARFKKAPKHVVFRVHLVVPADALSGGSSATTQPLEFV
jgi:hypothetical protein